MKEMIATVLLLWGVSPAQAQLGAVIPSSPAIPEVHPARLASLKASVSTPNKSLNQRDNLQGIKSCQGEMSSKHFDCVKGKIAKLRKENVFNPKKSSKLLTARPSHSYWFHASASKNAPLASQARFIQSNSLLSSVKKSHFKVPLPFLKPALSHKDSDRSGRIKDEFLSRFKGAKSYALKIPNYIHGLIEHYAGKYSVDSNLALAMLKQESGGNRYAVSKTGAMGLGQLMPATARRFGVTNPFDPRQNIAGMIRYLRFLKQKFNGDKVLMVAAYNSGEGRKSFRYGLIPRFHETIDYVRKVFGNYFRLTGDKINYSGRIAPSKLSA